MRQQSAAMRRRRNFIILFVIAVFFVTSISSRRGPVPREVDDSEPISDVDALDLPPPSSDYALTDTLIVVPGHGVFKGLDARRDWANESEWGLETFQQGYDGFLIKAFSQHIKRSLVELSTRGASTALVIFSGGQTRASTGPRSEGLSYYVVAEANDWFGVFPEVEVKVDVATKRVFAEEFARDSYENLLFSVCRYHEIAGKYPRKIVVVNWEYKRRRFEELHRVALRWHKADFEYIGIDIRDAAKALHLEVPESLSNFSDARTLERVESDLYCCKVNEKVRIERNPQRRVIPYLTSCKDIRDFLLYCGPHLYEETALPWG